MPVLTWPDENTRTSWWLPRSSVEAFWGSPLDPDQFLKDNPANLVGINAVNIRSSDLDIYLEVGGQDFIQL